MRNITKNLFLVSIMILITSCSSTKSTSNRQHVECTADSLASVSRSEHIDSTAIYHQQIDSLIEQNKKFRNEITSLKVADSVSRATYRKDSVYVKDSTVVQINADGSKNTLIIRERNHITSELQQEFTSRIRNEYKNTIDSLQSIVKNDKLVIDMLERYTSDVDSLSYYRTKSDSLQNIVETTKTEVQKESFWSKLCEITVFYFIVGMIGYIVYLWVKRYIP